MAKLKLTKSAVDAAQPQAQAVELRDTLVPGFLLLRQLDKIEAEGLEYYVIPLAIRLFSTASGREACPYVLPSPNDPGKHLTDAEYYDGWSRVRKAAEPVANRCKTVVAGKQPGQQIRKETASA